jgi:4-amino-4-deoxy-L-arabinose transferase-like glycosyltransferase
MDDSQRLAGSGWDPVLSTPAARARRVLRGLAGQALWERPALIGLLLVTLLLYLWGLDRNGWANTYYAAAVQAATKSWKAFFFGSLDASNFITVDKSPAFLWVMDASARIFGVNSWSIQVPQAIEGVATVALTYAGVRRWFGPAAGLLAGAVVALTPVAALMFRYNNPDSLLLLLVTAGSYSTLRAVESGRTRWLVLAAALIGTGFLAKMLQAFLIVPVLVLVYLAAGRLPLLQRVKQLGLAGLTLLVASGWWVAIVELWPASSRPYVGGSQTNSVIELILGYNGFGRLNGNEVGSIGGAIGGLGGTISRWGPTGWDRLFTSQFGGQISWLIPGALILLGAGLWYTRTAGRTDMARVALAVWGGWLLITGAVLSFAQGIIHPYYTIALAPPIGSLVGAGAVLLWRRRSEIGARLVMATAVAVTAWWSYVLLARTPDWQPALRGAVIVAGIAVPILIVGVSSLSKRLTVAVAAAAIALSLAGPAAYTLQTVQTAHSGALVSAGPVALSADGFGGRHGVPGGFRGGITGAGGFAGPRGVAGPGGFARGGVNRVPSGFGGGGPRMGGGFLNGSQAGPQLAALLEANANEYQWVAATIDANSAAGYELASGQPVMAIGGFNGTDPAPTLAQFQQLVGEGKIHYFIAGGGVGSSSDANEIAFWVSEHFTQTTVDGVSVYDLTSGDASIPG